MDFKRSKEKLYSYNVKDATIGHPWNRYLGKIPAFVATLVIVLIIASIPQIVHRRRHHRIERKLERYSTDLKYILLWKGFEDQKPLINGQKLFIEQRCEYINCYFTYNKSLLQNDPTNFDAVIFNARDIRKRDHNLLKMPRSVHQKYIFRSMESSDKFTVCNKFFDGFFNWTWTYKLNSDIPHSFFNIYDTSNKRIGPNIEIEWLQHMKHDERFKHKIDEKKLAVAWIVPKCSIKLKGEDFVQKLKREVESYNHTLDIFGACAPKKCPDGQLWKCYKMLEKSYYFNVVIEEFNSEDYITEMIVKTMSHTTIPIVMGGSNFTRFLPPGSYLDAEEHTIKQLGSIIHYLMQHPQTYGFLFDWKNHYYYTEKPRHYVCDLCAKMNDKESVEIQTVYDHFRYWWNPDFRDHCTPRMMRNGTRIEQILRRY